MNNLATMPIIYFISYFTHRSLSLWPEQFPEEFKSSSPGFIPGNRKVDCLRQRLDDIAKALVIFHGNRPITDDNLHLSAKLRHQAIHEYKS